jgi:hypothetical protein
MSLSEFQFVDLIFERNRTCVLQLKLEDHARFAITSGSPLDFNDLKGMVAVNLRKDLNNRHAKATR